MQAERPQRWLAFARSGGAGPPRRRLAGPRSPPAPAAGFSRTTAPSADLQREAVRGLERAGYRAVWTNEAVGGKDALVQLAVLLAATGRVALGTAIANIWARAPQTAHGAAALLAQAYPGRFVLGLGVGHPHQAASAGREFGRPAEIADGAIPAMVPPEFTAQARQLLGPAKLLVAGLAVVVDADPGRARATARQTVAGRLGQPGTYAAKVREHLAAGADRVMVMLTGNDFADGVDQLEQLAPVLAGLTGPG